MEEHGLHLHAGVAHERVAQVAEFPARLGIDDEDLQRFLADGEREFLLVVVGKNLVLLDWNLDGEVALALRLRSKDAISCTCAIGATVTSFVRPSSRRGRLIVTLVCTARGSWFCRVTKSR